MFGKRKKKGVFAVLIALALGAAVLLRDFQKEQVRVQKEEAVSQVEGSKQPEKKVESYKKRTKEVQRDMRTDAGYDAAQMIAQLITIARKLEKLEDIVYNNNFNTASALPLGEDRDRSDDENFDVAAARKERTAFIDTVRQMIVEVKEKVFTERADLTNVIGSAKSTVRFLKGVKGYLGIASAELESAQREITSILHELSGYPQTREIKEIQEKLERMGEKIIRKLQIYDIKIDGYIKVISMREAAISEWEKLAQEKGQ